MQKASLKPVLLLILLVLTSSTVAGRSVEAAKCVRDIDCSFQCPSGRGVCVDKTHECFCLPREETQVEMESTTACAHDGGCD
ncbi:hypothetical protein POTOM_055825 [Populus tomentosa]|uniref:Uncharacterized protein n=1 Tax=Populus tomentosa TaxID=118781 RepID=A0A8X8BY01_POPTO|nr:hypothetical protein POTOM_055825 [Populus tomentosa]